MVEKFDHVRKVSGLSAPKSKITATQTITKPKRSI
jgi:hypothetical protein